MNHGLRWAYLICGVVGLLVIAIALDFWGAKEIRDNQGEEIFLSLAGCAWMVVATSVFSWLGLSHRDDVVERKNDAALVALCGALLAAAFIYAGGSVGEGPSYWNNVFSAGLAGAGGLALWIVLELGAGVSRSVTEERDLASGVRLGAFLLACGLLLGRAVAGDWHSEEATVRDFIHDGWLAAALCAMAVVIERFARPSRSQPFPPWQIFGLLPALFYLALAGAWLWHLGAWEGMPR